jgi:acylglycerol lipase
MAHGSRNTEEKFVGAGGFNIFLRTWQPQAPPRGVMVLVHGFNSHSGYYAWAAEQFTSAGFAVYALDLRGRGKSDGDRFWVDNYTEYVSDVAHTVRIAKSREPGLPVFLLGHSAGGVISSVYTIEHQAELAGFICESFAYQVPAPDFVLQVLKGISHIVPHAKVLHLKNGDFSRDPNVVQAMNDDPYVGDETQPAHTVAQMVLADERLKREFPLIKIPVLILHGTVDKATKPEGSKFFYETAGSKDKTLKLYEGHFHDLLNDYDRDVVMADIIGWINARMPGVHMAAATARTPALA